MSSKEEEKKHQQEQKKARELITLMVDELQPAALDETMDAIFRHDPSLARDLVYSLPNLMRAEARFAKEIAEYLESFVPEERSAVLKEIMGEFDGKLAAEAANSVSRAVMLIHRENPELARELFPALEDFYTTTDFGKVRESVTALADYWTVLAERSVELAMENPVVIANVVGMLPPLVNGLLRVLSHALGEMNLPPEILASALFNILSALDAEELGRALTRASEQVNALHAGNLILGRDEPRFRAIFTDFLKRVLDNMDVDTAAAAAAALGEDLEVVVGVISELAMRDPELLVEATRAVMLLTNSAARMTTGMLSEACKLQPEVLARVGTEARADLDPVEVGKAIDLYAEYALIFRGANPGLNRDVYTSVLSAVNTEQMEAWLKEVGEDLRAAALANPGIRKALEPEEVGRRLNEALVSFNRSAAGRPGAVGEYVTRLLSAVDTLEIETAVHNVSAGMIDAVFASADRVGAIVKTAASNLFRVARHVVGYVMKRFLG